MRAPRRIANALPGGFSVAAVKKTMARLGLSAKGAAARRRKLEVSDDDGLGGADLQEGDADRQRNGHSGADGDSDGDSDRTGTPAPSAGDVSEDDAGVRADQPHSLTAPARKRRSDASAGAVAPRQPATKKRKSKKAAAAAAAVRAKFAASAADHAAAGDGADMLQDSDDDASRDLDAQRPRSAAKAITKRVQPAAKRLALEDSDDDDAGAPPVDTAMEPVATGAKTSNKRLMQAAENKNRQPLVTPSQRALEDSDVDEPAAPASEPDVAAKPVVKRKRARNTSKAAKAAAEEQQRQRGTELANELAAVATAVNAEGANTTLVNVLTAHCTLLPTAPRMSYVCSKHIRCVLT